MDSDNEAPKDPGVCQQRYTEQDYEGNIKLMGIKWIIKQIINKLIKSNECITLYHHYILM